MASQLITLLDNHIVRVKTRSGRVTVRAEARADLLVERGQAMVAGAEVTITGASGGSGPVEIRVPEGTRLTVGTASGSVELAGRLGAVYVTGASGGIHVDSAGALDLRTASGKVHVGSCSGPCRVHTMSGNVDVGRAGETDIATVSGDVEVDAVERSARVHTVSGQIDVGCAGPADAQVKTMSGGVTLRYPAGVAPEAKFRSASGKTRSDCPQGDDCTVRVVTFSGNVQVIPQ